MGSSGSLHFDFSIIVVVVVLFFFSFSYVSSSSSSEELLKKHRKKKKKSKKKQDDHDDDNAEVEVKATTEVEIAKAAALEKLLKVKKTPKENRLADWRALLREYHPDKNPD